MKIIITDNFDRDYISDRLVAVDVDDYHARLIVKLLNDNEKDPHSPNFYRYVTNDFELYIWKP